VGTKSSNANTPFVYGENGIKQASRYFETVNWGPSTYSCTAGKNDRCTTWIHEDASRCASCCTHGHGDDKCGLRATLCNFKLSSTDQSSCRDKFKELRVYNSGRSMLEISSSIVGFTPIASAPKQSGSLRHRLQQRPEVSFLIVGAQKAGTTALALTLNRHKHVFIHPIELEYFSVHWKNGNQWYEQQFKEAPRGALVGEKSADYLWLHCGEGAWLSSSCYNTSRRIHTYNPAMKILISLRDPVKRIYSLYNMVKTLSRKATGSYSRAIRNASSFTEFCLSVNLKENTDIAHGVYVNQIVHLRRTFKAKQIHISIAERTFTSLNYSREFHFLGLDPNDRDGNSTAHGIRTWRRPYNEGEIDLAARCRLYAYYLPFTQALSVLLHDDLHEWHTHRHLCASLEYPKATIWGHSNGLDTRLRHSLGILMDQ